LATKMLASTMQISNNKQQPCQTHHQTPKHSREGVMSRCDGRPVPQTRNNGAHPPQKGAMSRPQGRHPTAAAPKRPVSSGPNSVSEPTRAPRDRLPTPVPRKGVQAVPTTRANPGHPISQCSTNERAMRETNAHEHGVDPAAYAAWSDAP